MVEARRSGQSNSQYSDEQIDGRQQLSGAPVSDTKAKIDENSYPQSGNFAGKNNSVQEGSMMSKVKNNVSDGKKAFSNRLCDQGDKEINVHLQGSVELKPNSLTIYQCERRKI